MMLHRYVLPYLLFFETEEYANDTMAIKNNDKLQSIKCEDVKVCKKHFQV
jgi:hypothetical protein